MFDNMRVSSYSKNRGDLSSRKVLMSKSIVGLMQATASRLPDVEVPWIPRNFFPPNQAAVRPPNACMECGAMMVPVDVPNGTVLVCPERFVNHPRKRR